MAAVTNADYVEDLHERWRRDPTSVDEQWQMFFAGFELASGRPRAEPDAAQSQVASLIFAYRSLGHLVAEVDPLRDEMPEDPGLAIEHFGLSEEHLDRVFDTGHLGGPRAAMLSEIISILKEIYCRSIGVEYLHIQDRAIRRWLQAEMEPTRNRPPFSKAKQREVLRNLINAELFESFVQRRYPGQKRFSLEGSESLIPALHAFVELAPQLNIEELVIGMAHRGRLNVLANILDKPYEVIFSEFEDILLPEWTGGDGDVKYHRGFSSDHVNDFGRSLHISLTANPSHLEAVDPVVEGRARAKQRRRNDTENRSRVVPLLIHGDAAFAGQGLVAETINLSQLEGYSTGGTVHFIVNNQIGFTACPKDARSSLYSTDVAKMVEAPVFHVNGDDPEAVVYVTELALRFRQKWKRDVVIDMVCYRRHGHNESDEPAFTQPVMYSKIKSRPTVRVQYKQHLVEAKEMTQEESDQLAEGFQARLQQAFESIQNGNRPESRTAEENTSFGGVWVGLNNPFRFDRTETGVPHETLSEITHALTTVPDGFNVNPKVERQLKKRLEAVEGKGHLDWALAESLAFGSLLIEDLPVRLSGQDSKRGTFSQRHAEWHDTKTQEAYVPLNHIRENQAHFCSYNSMLSEAAVLGFDYGYSLDEPHMLVLWEAQFGDFANGAQVIIDQFIVASLAKWQHASGLVMLLPHGYEGQGPEHSNAYLERYLAACAQDNVQVAVPSTPAQYFHVLRRQLKRDFRRPLIVMSPKSLLRHKRAVSPVDQLTTGSFREILDDEQPPEEVKRIALCSGKIYYDLLEMRQEGCCTALIRMEQLYPFHEELLEETIGRYPSAKEIYWVQEEPQNRGAWTFMYPRLLEICEQPIQYVGRPASASAATGSLLVHKREQATIVQRALLGANS